MDEVVMVCGAHPDDQHRNMGPTMYQLKANGHKLVDVCLTSGQHGAGNQELRSQEFVQASQILGADVSIVMNLIDTEVRINSTEVRTIATLVRQYKPKVVDTVQI